MSPSKSTSALSHFQQSGQIKNLPSSSQEFSRGLTSGNSNEKKQQQQAKEKKSEVAKPEAKKEDNSSKDKSEKKEKKQSKVKLELNDQCPYEGFWFVLLK